MMINLQKATTQLAAVIPFYDSGQYQKAIDGEPGTNVVGLASIVDNFGSTNKVKLQKCI